MEENDLLTSRCLFVSHPKCSRGSTRQTITALSVALLFCLRVSPKVGFFSCAKKVGKLFSDQGNFKDLYWRDKWEPVCCVFLSVLSKEALG